MVRVDEVEVGVRVRVGTAVDPSVGVSDGGAVGVEEAIGIGEADAIAVGVATALVSSTKTQSPAPSELLPAGVNGCSPLFANGEPEIAT
jgi:hypothetical protein